MGEVAMLQSVTSQNEILAALPEAEYAEVLLRATRVELEAHTILQHRGNPIEYVYFPQSGLVSLLAFGSNGRGVETGIVAREGLVSSVVVLGSATPSVQATVHIKGHALK